MALTTYAKAALPLVPLASRLPFVAGGGGAMPVDALTREFTASTDPERLAAYAKVCGFRFGDVVPPTWPHILAFDAHMAVMTDGRFPFQAIGLVHLANRIEQKRPIRAGEELSLIVAPTEPKPHPKGKTFALVTEARADGKLVWRETSTMLRRGGGEGKTPPKRKQAVDFDAIDANVTWKLPGDLGRRYASVSGDSNPIHMHPLSARAFGFPRAIAHGMWTKARALAAHEGRLPDKFTVDVEFKKPILLPGAVAFGIADGAFVVRDPKSGASHLEGTIK